MNPQFNEIGTAFVQHYYQLFQTDRSQLLSLYQEDSLMSFEGAQAQGLQAIKERLEVLVINLTSLPPTLTCAFHRDCPLEQ